MRSGLAITSSPPLLLIAAVLAGAVSAQERLPATPGDAVTTPLVDATIAGLGRGAHLQRDGSAFVGGGPRYVVRFGDGSMEFTPAFGRAAPHSTPLRFELAEVRRGSSAVDVAAGAAPVSDGTHLRVDYDHGAFVERYDLVEDGVEQSFVFDRLPPGSGDLIVRGRLECELPATADAGGLRFDLAGVGHFRIGKVTGIAADGARADGAVRLVDGQLELSLPEAFVRDAALPLTLDPLVGSAFPVNVGSLVFHAPCIAYDLTTDRYLVVWTQTISSSDSNIVGQLVSGSGTLLGMPNYIESSTGYANEPAVANINADDAFVVTFTRNGDVIAVAVSTVLTPPVLIRSAEAVVAGGTVSEHESDLGGEATLLDDRALCVWKAEGLSISPSSIMARPIAIDNGTSSNIAVTMASPAVRVLGGGHQNPSISRNAGPGQRYAIVTDYPTTPTNRDVYVTIVNHLGQPISAVTPVSTLAFGETNAAVDGDGINWVASWMTLVTAGDHDVHARAFSFEPSSGTVGFNGGGVSIADDFNDDEGWPSVCWTGGSCLVGYMDELTSTLWSAYVKSVDLFQCNSCEGEFPLLGSNATNLTPQIACKTAGVLSPEDAMIVWESADAAISNGDIMGQLWTTKDGHVTPLAGSCGKGGTCYATCARLLNTSFAYQLRGASVLSPTVFLLSGTRLDFPCGPCTVVPNPATGIVVALSTNASGDASLSSPIGNNVSWLNVPLFVQWATVSLAAPSCAKLKLDTSNALQMSVER